jgi:hypothetical protein
MYQGKPRMNLSLFIVVCARAANKPRRAFTVFQLFGSVLPSQTSEFPALLGCWKGKTAPRLPMFVKTESLPLTYQVRGRP